VQRYTIQKKSAIFVGVFFIYFSTMQILLRLNG